MAFYPIASAPRNERVILSGNAYAKPPDDEMCIGWVDDDGKMYYTCPHGGEITWRVMYWSPLPRQPLIVPGNRPKRKHRAKLKAEWKAKNRPNAGG